MVSLKPELLVMSVEITGEPVYHISLSVEDHNPTLPDYLGPAQTRRIESGPCFLTNGVDLKKLPIKLIEVSSEKKSVD